MRNSSHEEIHRKLRKHSPKGVKKAKKIFSFKYAKFFICIILILATYYLFTKPIVSKLIEFFNGLGHVGIFISGMLTSVAFSAPLGFSLLDRVNISNLLIIAAVAGLGASIMDLIIFKSVKSSFSDEFKKLEKTKLFWEIEHIVNKNKSVLIRHYLLYIFAGIVLALPLPDEIGISMFAGLTTIKPSKLMIVSFMIHTIVILLVLSII